MKATRILIGMTVALWLCGSAMAQTDPKASDAPPEAVSTTQGSTSADAAKPMSDSTPTTSVQPNASSGDTSAAPNKAGTDVPLEIAKESIEPLVDVKQQIGDQMEATCRKFEVPGRTKLYTATERVKAAPTDKDWVKSRSVAYETAVLDAQTDFVSEQDLHIVAETAQHIEKAALPNEEPPPYDDSALKSSEAYGQLVRKLVALGTGKVDEELRKLGIDPKEYEKEPEPQRYHTMQIALKKTAAEFAIGSLVGMVPVQTFEGNDGKGAFYVGVCMVASQAMKDLAAQVLTARGKIPPDPSRAQDLTGLYKDHSQLYRYFGVRRVFDQDGYPAVVSFYQWGSSYRGTDSVTGDEFQEEAMRQATDLADAQLAEFLKGSMDYRTQAQAGETFDKSIDRFPDGGLADNEATREAVDGAIRDMRKRAQVDVVGLRTLYSWHSKHPITGQEIVGVIRIWSAQGERTTREFKDNRHPAVDTAQATPKVGNAGVTSGQELMKPDDF